MSRIQEERRAAYKRYKEDVDKRGKPFFPYAMFHDTVMSLVVVTVIVVLAVVWKYSIPGSEGDEGYGTEAGALGPLYAEKADPGTTEFVPRPDWYFYFLFYLLRIFKWPDSVILGTIGIPTIGLILLLALPFIDRRRERRLKRRPVAIVALLLTIASMGVLTYKGATVREAVGGDPEVIAEEFIANNNLSEEVREGAVQFVGQRCGQCHIYLGEGSANLGAPELTAIGAEEGKDASYFHRYVSNPREFGNSVMPVYGEVMSDEQLRQLSEFLAASKGEGG